MYEKGLETFLAVAMSKTLKDAAVLMSLSQSTVSYNLKNFEELLGVELVDRRKGHKVIQLTSSGKALLPLALKWSEIIREIQSFNSTQQYYLSIGGVESVNYCILPDLYNSLVEHKIYCKISTDLSIELYKMLDNRVVDVAFVVTEIPYDNVNITQFKQENMCVLRSNLCECEEFITIGPHELDPDFELYVDWSFAFQVWHDNVWPQLRTPRLKIDSFYQLDSLLVGDARYWIIVPNSVAQLYRSKGLKIQYITPEPPERKYYKITHRKPHSSVVPALEEFDKIFKSWCRKKNFISREIS